MGIVNSVGNIIFLRNITGVVASVAFGGLLVTGCGGSGGGNSRWEGDWDGLWTDEAETSQGAFSIRVDDDGSFDGNADTFLEGCGESFADVSGSFRSNGTRLDAFVDGNEECVAHTIRADGDELERIDEGSLNGWITNATARFFRDGDEIGSVDWVIYIERPGGGAIADKAPQVKVIRTLPKGDSIASIAKALQK